MGSLPISTNVGDHSNEGSIATRWTEHLCHIRRRPVQVLGKYILYLLDLRTHSAHTYSNITKVEAYK